MSIGQTPLKKLFSLLLTIQKLLLKCFVFALVAALAMPYCSMPVSADDGTNYVADYSELVSAVNTASEGDTITLAADIVVESEISLSNSLTINGNGHTISVPVPGFDDSGIYNDNPSAFRVF